MLYTDGGDLKKIFAPIVYFILIACLLIMRKSAPLKGFDPHRVAYVWTGNVDFFGPVKAASNSYIKANGWAADVQAGNLAKALLIVCDGKQMPLTLKKFESRRDVAKFFRNGNLEQSGWEVILPASSLGIGKHKVEFYAVLTDYTFAPLHCCGASKFCEVEVVR